jgi:hypothetical protein
MKIKGMIEVTDYIYGGTILVSPLTVSFYRRSDGRCQVSNLLDEYINSSATRPLLLKETYDEVMQLIKEALEG